MKTAHPYRHDAGTTVVALRGELDVAALPELRARLRRAIRPGATVVLDLQDVTFMDSSALSVVLTAERQLRATDGSLQLTHVAEEVLRVLRICGLADRLVRPGRTALTSLPTGRPLLVSDLVR